MSDKWLRCSKNRHCPICGKPDWCTISASGEIAYCMRIESDWRAPKGGWFHRLVDQPPQPPPRSPRRIATAASILDFESIIRDYKTKTDDSHLRHHAGQLGVSVDGLCRLGIVWAAPYRAWGFPMRDDDGQIVGLRLRSESGQKWAMPGSHQGLFWPEGKPVEDELILICEGPTDTAAMLDLGFYGIGRPSCNSCEAMLEKLLGKRHVIVIGDRDEPKHRPDGSTFCPGQEGARSLANRLVATARSVKIVYPLKGKDARAWLAAGATRGQVLAVISQRPLWRPSPAGGTA